MGYTWTVEVWNWKERRYNVSWEGNNFQEALENMKMFSHEGYQCIRLTYRGKDFEEDMEVNKWATI